MNFLTKVLHPSILLMGDNPQNALSSVVKVILALRDHKFNMRDSHQLHFKSNIDFHTVLGVIQFNIKNYCAHKHNYYEQIPQILQIIKILYLRFRRARIILEVAEHCQLFLPVMLRILSHDRNRVFMIPLFGETRSAKKKISGLFLTISRSFVDAINDTNTTCDFFAKPS